MNRKRIGIVGATGTALKRVIPALSESKLCKVEVILARDEKQLKEISKRYSIPRFYTNIDEFVADSNYDIIYIATPPLIHFECIQAVKLMNKPIICEKPLSINPIEYEYLRNDVSLLSKNLFMIGHHLRHQSSIAKIKELLDYDIIGNILNVSMNWAYQMSSDANNYSWKSHYDQGGNAIDDIGIHMVDISTFLFGQPEKIVRYDNAESYQNSIAELRYANFNVCIYASQLTNFSDNSLTIVGSKGRIVVPSFFGDFASQKVILYQPDGVKVFQFNDTNLYRAEFDNFATYINNPQSSFIGTTIEEALTYKNLFANYVNR